VAYTVSAAPSAQEELGNLPRHVQVRIATKIGELATDPRPPGVKKLQDAQDLYRLRVGDYRIVYMIDDAAQGVLITAIGHRSEIYRRGLGP
jgi:mRNA interferase RelE/StbE